MVVRRVLPVSLPPPLTKLPRVTSVRLMRPEIGAVMRQKLSSSSAVLTRASATFTAAVASRTRFSRSSKVFLEMASLLSSGLPRSTSRLELLTRTLASLSWALA